MERSGIYVGMLFFCMVLTGCMYETPEEAVIGQWSNELEVKEVIDKQKIDDESTIAFYAAEDKEAINDVESIGVAVVEDEGVSGWKMTTSSGGTAESVPFSAGHEVFFVKDNDDALQEIPIAYGKISDERITSIDAKINGETKEIEIQTTLDGDRYFFETNAWGPIRALDETGEVIDQY